MNAHTSCIKQSVNPTRYLDTEDAEDFFVWTNRNGDYVFDHNFEETAENLWVCNDFNTADYVYSMSSDDNLFCVGNAHDLGTLSFGLVAPDGTGIGYMAWAGESAGFKTGTFFIDSGTPFDGLYCDNQQEKKTPGTFFIGHDSITGMITDVVGVEEAAPAAFAVAQNSPNPFNPNTNISFSIADAGNVTVEVYNVAGQKVDTLSDGFMDAGSHSVVWDASGFSAGIYFYTVKSGDFSRTIKMTLLK